MRNFFKILLGKRYHRKQFPGICEEYVRVAIFMERYSECSDYLKIEIIFTSKVYFTSDELQFTKRSRYSECISLKQTSFHRI